MRIHRFRVLGVLIALLSGAAAPLALAQENPPDRVGRLSYIGGSVSFEPAGTQSWTAAELNRPVTIGDRIWTDWDSRAEIELGDAVVRLGSRTGFSLLNLDSMTAQIQLTAGTLIVRVRSLADGEQDEIDTPNLALSLQQPGTYRVEVDSAGDATRVEVISGEALASGGGQSFPVTAQQSAVFSGTDTLNVIYATLGVPDALDEWSMARDRQEQQSASQVASYVAPDTVGIYDLDTYGSWQDTAQWGYAWFPNVVVGWAPYRFGHWVWIFPWGWTWVDNEPWGFAPFHYGRWGYWHNAWCWIPGPRNVRPVYAPALVAWAHGPRDGGPRSGPQVGWLPLGPRDVYVPGYAANAAYVRSVNLANARDLTPASFAAAYRRGPAGLRYANRDVPGAITAVPRAAFSASRATDAHRVVLNRRGLLNVRLSPEAPAITPSRASVFGARVHNLQVPPRQLTNRPVVARLLPARAAVSFARQQAAIQANGGRMPAPLQWARLRPNTPASPVRLAPQTRPAAPPSSQRRPRGEFTSRPQPMREPAVPGAYPRPQSQYRSDRPAWARSPQPAGRPGVPVRAPRPPAAREVLPSRAPQFPAERPAPRPESPPRERAPPRAPRARPVPEGRPPLEVSMWNSAPPMYRAQEVSAPVRPDPSLRSAISREYAPPRSPPPMYRVLTPAAVAPAPPTEYRPAAPPEARVWRPHQPGRR